MGTLFSLLKIPFCSTLGFQAIQRWLRSRKAEPGVLHEEGCRPKTGQGQNRRWMRTDFAGIFPLSSWHLILRSVLHLLRQFCRRRWTHLFKIVLDFRPKWFLNTSAGTLCASSCGSLSGITFPAGLSALRLPLHCIMVS